MVEVATIVKSSFLCKGCLCHKAQVAPLAGANETYGAKAASFDIRNSLFDIPRFI
jgi:hypothetical protein